MEADHSINTVSYYLLNFVAFAIGFGITRYICFKNNKIKRYILLGCLLLSFTFLLSLIVSSTDSKYKLVNLNKCLTKRETDKFFKTLLKTHHPDNYSKQDTQDNTYKLYNDQRELLTDHYLRNFYEKYNYSVTSGSYSKSKSESILQYLFQEKLNSHFHLSFFLLSLVLYIFYRGKIIEYNGFLIKVLFCKTFIIIYSLYFKKSFECGLLDNFFPKQTLHQQLYYIEIYFSFLFGVTTLIFYNYYINERKILVGKCDVLLKIRSEAVKPKISMEHVIVLKNLKEFYS